MRPGILLALLLVVGAGRGTAAEPQAEGHASQLDAYIAGVEHFFEASRAIGYVAEDRFKVVEIEPDRIKTFLARSSKPSCLKRPRHSRAR